MNQQEIASRCGVSQTTVCRWLKGYANPTMTQGSLIEALENAREEILEATYKQELTARKIANLVDLLEDETT